MPVKFLSDQQDARCGGYNAPPDDAQLERYSTMSDADLERLRRKRKAVTRLGFAAQLATLRFLGTFLETPGDIPDNALAFLRSQLGLPIRVTPRAVQGVGDGHRQVQRYGFRLAVADGVSVQSAIGELCRCCAFTASTLGPIMAN